MRARWFRRSAVVVAGVALLSTLTPFSPTDADAALPGAFDGELLCDGGFETEGHTGESRPDLTGPCWFDLALGGEITGRPRFVPSGLGNRVLELCGYQDCGEAVAQPITVPYGITDATLSADFLEFDEDTSEDDCLEEIEQSDAIVAYIEDAVEGTFQIFLCEAGGGSGPQHLEADVTDALAQLEGQETNIMVYSLTSPQDVGETFQIDNLSLLVSAEGQAMTTYPRKATLSLKNHLKATGKITSTDLEAWADCWVEVTVRFQRKKGKEWVTLTKKATTNNEGTYSVMLPDRQGTYRAVVDQSKLDVAHRCGRVVSPLRTHEH